MHNRSGRFFGQGSTCTCYLLPAEWPMDASRDSIHLPWFRSSTRQKRALRAHTCRQSARRGRPLFRRGYSCRWWIMAYWAVFEEHFLDYDDFPRHCKWLISVDRYPSTMERKLVVGIRDFCILSSRKACLEGNEKEKLTREVLSVLMVAQKSTRRRVE